MWVQILSTTAINRRMSSEPEQKHPTVSRTLAASHLPQAQPKPDRKAYAQQTRISQQSTSLNTFRITRLNAISEYVNRLGVSWGWGFGGWV